MKEIVEYFYDLKVLGFIRLNETVYKIKCENKFYYLKFSEDNHLEEIIDYIESIHLKCFVNVLKNIENCVLTKYKDKYFYIMEELVQSHSMMKEVKIKYYFEILAYIHNHSYYNVKVNQEYYKRIYNDTMNIINERIFYYDKLMNDFETLKYKSPSQWLFLLNYYRIHSSLNEAIQYLKRYMNKVENSQSTRVCLIYKHFHYDHIFLKNNKLISIDKMIIDIPIYDIYDIYQKLPDILFDLDCFSEYYLKNMCLYDDEILLLCTLLKISPMIYMEDDEISNIIKISRLLYYLDSINSLCNHIDKQKDGEFH